MTPFPKPLPAMWLDETTPSYQKHEPEPVAIVATSDDEFLAIDARGRTIVAPHGEFTISDGDVRQAIWNAEGGS